jgi:hypothetical protein
MPKPYVPGHSRRANLTTRTLSERAAWGKRAKTIVHQEKLPTPIKEKTMSRYDRWRRIATPEPAVPKPGSPRSKLLDITARIGRTGVIARGDLRELAECYALEDADWARFFQTSAQAHTLK